MTTPINQHDKFHRPTAAADLLGLSRDQVYRAIREGKLRARRFGNRYMVSDSAIRDFLDGADNQRTTHRRAS